MNADRLVWTRRLSWMLALGFLLIGFGCSKNPRVYAVRGEVFVNGQPASGATIVLHPCDKAKGLPAYATVQEDGSFKMSTYSKFDGATLGDYIVTVSWSDERIDDGETIFGPDKLGERYGKRESSGLKVTVQTGKNELPRFDLN